MFLKFIWKQQDEKTQCTIVNMDSRIRSRSLNFLLASTLKSGALLTLFSSSVNVGMIVNCGWGPGTW